MNTTSVVEATFNPILHPFHWIAGHGSWVDEYTSIVSNEKGGEVHFGKQYSAQTGEGLSGELIFGNFLSDKAFR
jgi:regulatory protein YycH of two-component signal transduction system YycFG